MTGACGGKTFADEYLQKYFQYIELSCGEEFDSAPRKIFEAVVCDVVVLECLEIKSSFRPTCYIVSSL